MKLGSFFRNKDGDIVIMQKPNFLITVWLVLQMVNTFVFSYAYAGFTALTLAVLLVWSYLELAQGESPFRRAIGGVVTAGAVLAILFTL